MKFSYKFSNLLGTVYKRGNIEFLPHTDTLASPVGNRLSLFNLKENLSETLPIFTKYNIVCQSFSPDGCMAILIDEKGEASLVSLISKTVIHRFLFRKPVQCISFSTDGKKFAVAMEKVILVYYSPGKTRELNPFTLHKAYHGAFDDVTCLDWTSDSSAFAAGGKDMTTRIFAAKNFKNLIRYSLGGHKDEIVGCFFEENSLDIYTVSRDGALNIWESDIDLEDLVLDDTTAKTTNGEKEDDSGTDDSMEKVHYKRISKFFYNKEGDFNSVSSVAFHKRSHILVTGFVSGSFYLHELPDFSLIQSLSISEQRISTVGFNESGEWLALACSGIGQLLVWEWQSETYILKQSGHFNNMRCLDYSPDGRYIVTGGEDSKVKIWDTSTGFCFVTFTEHSAAVTGTIFTSNGYVVVTSSLDGTVRAFDLHRYRNFRTFTSPRPVQFVSLAVDRSGDVVCAGSHDTFEIFLWSMQTGRLLEIMAGHEAPVVSLSFSSCEALLASGSWDGTVKLWNVLEGNKARETLQLDHDVLAVSFSPDGSEIAVSSINAEISFWNVHNAVQKGCIECRLDIRSGRGELDRISAKSSSLGKAYDTLSYTADGEAIIAGGKFPHVCIYNVKECLLVKDFKITQNLSFDAMEEFLDKRKMTDFGPASLVDMDESENGVALKLPGVQKGDMSSRAFKPEVRVMDVRFSPTGREWAAVSTEGLLIYSLDANMVFDPFNLDIEVTPETIHQKLHQKEFSVAIMMAFNLNEKPIIGEVVENVPLEAIDVISSSLPLVYVEKLLEFAACQLENSQHMQFYALWCQHLLLNHSVLLKQRSNKIMHILNRLSKNLTTKLNDIGKLCNANKYQMQYIFSLSSHISNKRLKSEQTNETEQSESEDEWNDIVAENYASSGP